MQFAKTFFVVELLVEYGSYLKQMTRTQFAQFISEITFQGDNDKSGFLLWNQNEKIIPITFHGQVYNFNVDSDNIDSICTRLGYKFDLQRMINQHNAYYSSVISEQITPSRLNIHIFLAMLAQYVCDECGKEDLIEPKSIVDKTKIFINGNWVGVHKNPHYLVSILRTARR